MENADMTGRHGPCRWALRKIPRLIVLAVLFVLSFEAISNTLTLFMSGPSTAREGNLIEYRLEVLNEGTANAAGVEVLDTLPATVDLVTAMSTPDGTYDPASGIWTLPILGTSAENKAAELRLQVLVGPDLLSDPNVVLTAINRAEIVAPQPTEPIEAELATNIVCAFCIDWEIASVELGYEDKFDDGKYRSEYLFHVRVANNGPVMSEATLSATHFNISGGGYGTVTLMPSMPVTVDLDAGETQIVTYTTGWVDGADSDYEMTWKFEVSDVSLLDPILPNAASGSFEGDVEGGPGGGGGCTINEHAATDPVWLILLIITSVLYRRCRKRSLGIAKWRSASVS